MRMLFSTMRLLKHWNRSTMGEDRLTGLAFLWLTVTWMLVGKIFLRDLIQQEIVI